MPGASAPRGASPHTSILVLATAREQLAAQEHLIRELREQGHNVECAYAEGRFPVRASRRGRVAEGASGAEAVPERGDEPHRLVAAHTPSRPHRLILTMAPRLIGAEKRLGLAIRFDPWFRDTARVVDHLVLLDGGPSVIAAARLETQPTVHMGDAALRELVAQLSVARVSSLVDAAHRDLVSAAPAEPAEVIAPETYDELTTALEALTDATVLRAALADPGSIGIEPVAVPLRSLPGLTRDPSQVRDLVSRLGVLLGDDDAVLLAHRTRAELDDGGRTDADPVAAAVAVLETIDPLLGPGTDPGQDVAERVCLALDLIFHRELHSDSVDSPLLRDPATYLAPLRANHTWQVLTGAVRPGGGAPGATPTEDVAVVQHAPERVLVLPGAYGNFYRPLLDALTVSAAVEVRLVDRSTLRPHLRTMGTSPPVIRQRLRAAAGLPVDGYPELNALIRDWAPDVVVVDWADKTALLATLLAPPHTRLVMRVHGVDALRPWIHLLDWDRVDALVSVSAPLLELVRDVAGEPVRETEAHVIPNLIDLDRFGASGTDREAAREPHTLCLVGWAQRVKDPLWAVEVLARLRAEGGDWRLLLVGADFRDVPTASGALHAQAFRSRVLDDDVRGHLEFTGFVEDLPPVLARASFVLSTSLRESWPVGPAEAVAAGAVPVIRDWPMLRSRGGARAVYPAQWVVDSPGEAAERIRSLSGQVERREAALAAGARLREITNPVRTRSELRVVALGELGRLADLSERGEHDEALDLVRALLETETPSQAALQQAAISAMLAGELTLRLEVLRRWAEIDPREHVSQLVRQQESELRELDPD